MDMDLQIINDFSCHFLKNESYARCLFPQNRLHFIPLQFVRQASL